MDAKLVYSDADAATGIWHNVQFSLFTGQLKMHHIEPIVRLREETLIAYPQGVYSVIDLLPGTRLPMVDARGAAVDVMRRFQSSQLAMALIVEGHGTGVSALRAVVSAMLLATMSPSPRKVFDEPTAAVPWLVTESAKRNSGRMSGADLRAAMLHVRQAHLAKHQVAAAAMSV